MDELLGDFVEFWGQMSKFWGIPPATARIHAWLLTRADSAETDSIMEGLGMSRGAVSMACKELKDWGLITTERLHGQRRTLYRPVTDLEKVVRNVVLNRKRREWSPILDQLDTLIPQLRKNKSAEARIVRERLERIQHLVEAADSLADTFISGGTVRGLALKMMVSAALRKRKK